MWAPSRNDGGSPIRGYFVERCSSSKWIRVNKEPVDALSFVVRDLIQGADYQFRVNAINIEGKGLFYLKFQFNKTFTIKNCKKR